MFILNVFRVFSKVEFFCFNLILFIFVLIIGTIAQKELGIQSVQDHFFNSMVIWLFNIIPFPGGKTLIFLIFCSLICKIIDDKYTINKIGTLFIHIGIIFFICGAFLMQKTLIEGTMIIQEGSESNYFINKNDYDLIISTDNKIYSLNVIKNRKIIMPDIINLNTGVVKIQIIKFYKNSDLELQNNTNSFFNIKSILTFPESEYDKPSILICIYANNTKKFIYLIEDFAYKMNGTNSITVKLCKSKSILPFSISLIQFEKKVYLQTSMAKSYDSIILIKSNNLQWKSDIKMNKPFYLNGYTFYQTSFIEKDVLKATVLTVVKNHANKIFYLASLFVFLGLIWHTLKFLKVKYE